MLSEKQKKVLAVTTVASTAVGGFIGNGAGKYFSGLEHPSPKPSTIVWPQEMGLYEQAERNVIYDRVKNPGQHRDVPESESLRYIQGLIDKEYERLGKENEEVYTRQLREREAARKATVNRHMATGLAVGAVCPATTIVSGMAAMGVINRRRRKAEGEIEGAPSQPCRG